MDVDLLDEAAAQTAAGVGAEAADRVTAGRIDPGFELGPDQVLPERGGGVTAETLGGAGRAGEDASGLDRSQSLHGAHPKRRPPPLGQSPEG
jgi:hypothetical protein